MTEIQQSGDGAQPINPATAGAAPLLRVAQLGGCNLTQVLMLMPGVEVDLRIIRSSTASIVAPPLHVHAYRFSTCPLKSRFMLGDFSKNFAHRLANESWDVLLLEFQRDLVTGFVKTCGTAVTEFTAEVEGEAVAYEDIFEQPYEVVDWRHPDFFDQWVHGARQLFETILTPMIDRGRRVVMLEICPSLRAFEEGGEFDQEARDGDTDGRRRMSRRMYEFAASLDPRVFHIAVEPEYLISVFDSPYGFHFGHMISDFYTRAVEKILKALDMWTDETQSELAHRSLQLHIAQYHAAAARFVATDEHRADMAAARDAALAELGRARDRLNEVETAHSQRLAELAIMDEARGTLATCNESLRSELAEAKTGCDALFGELHTARHDIATLSGELAAISGKLSAVEAEHALALGMWQSADHEQTELRVEIARFREAERALIAENAGLIEARSRAAADAAERIAAADAAREDVEARLAEIAASHDAVVLALEAARGREDAVVAALEIERATREAERAAYEAESAAREAEISAERKEVANEAQALARRLTALRDEHQVIEARAREELDLRATESAHLERRLQAMVQAVEDLRGVAAALESDREGLHRRIDALLHSSSWRITAPLRGLKAAWLRMWNAA